MKKITATDFTGKFAWDALDIAHIPNASIRLHWTDQPYKWHINDGEEVFVVLQGEVEMYTRNDTREQIWPLQVGDIFHAQAGDEHVAHPKGQAHILVIETAGSV